MAYGNGTDDQKDCPVVHGSKHEIICNYLLLICKSEDNIGYKTAVLLQIIKYMNISRRYLIKGGLLSLATLISPFKTISNPLNTNFMEVKDPIKPELIKEFVRIAHSNIDKVKEMLAEEPALLNSAQDWGGGDFETALNAAGHMGRKDIAAVLLTAGARMDVFCAAMLGKLDIVKNILEAYPNLKTSKGPHGLMLFHHAKQGGEEAKAVLQYLESIGAS